MMNKLIFIFLILTYISTGSFAQGLELDMDAALELALENNLSLKASTLELEIMERNADTTWNTFLPSINFSTGLQDSDQIFTDSSLYENNHPWTFNLTLEASFTFNAGLTALIKQIKLDYEAQKISYETAKQELIKNVKKKFYYLLALREDLNLKQENLAIAEKRYLKAQANYEYGLIPGLEVLQAQVNYESQKPALSQALLDYETQLLNFKTLLGLSDAEIELTGELHTEFYDFNREELVRAWLNERPDIRLKMNEIEQLVNNKNLNIENNFTPTVSLFGSWGTNVNDPFNGSSWEGGYWQDTGVFGITLSIPLDGLFPRSDQQVTFKNDKDFIEKASIELKETIMNAVNEIDILLLKLETYKEKIGLSELNVKLAETNYRMTEESYNNGTSELLEVETAQTDLLKANQDLLLARFQYLSGLIDLEFALNTTIDQIIRE